MSAVNNVATTAVAAQTNAYQTAKKEQDSQKSKEVKSDEYAGSATTNKTGMYNKNGVKVDYDALATAKAEMKNNAGAFKMMVDAAKSNNTHSLNSKDANYWAKWVHSQLGKQYSVAEAKSLVADDGYWGVEQTSQRIVDFAKGLAGGDMSKYDKLLGAIEKGFGNAKASWGGKMPDITSQTYKAVMEKMAAWKADVEGTKKASEAINKPTGESTGFVSYITGKLNGKLDNASEIIEGLKNAVTLDGSKPMSGLLDERFVRREAALKIAEHISQNYMNKEDGEYFMSEMKKLAADTEKREIALGNSTHYASHDDYVKGIEQPVDVLLDKWKKHDFIAAYSDWDMSSVLKSFSKPNGKSFDDVMSKLMSDTSEKVNPQPENDRLNGLHGGSREERFNTTVAMYEKYIQAPKQLAGLDVTDKRVVSYLQSVMTDEEKAKMSSLGKESLGQSFLFQRSMHEKYIQEPSKLANYGLNDSRTMSYLQSVMSDREKARFNSHQAERGHYQNHNHFDNGGANSNKSFSYLQSVMTDEEKARLNSFQPNRTVSAYAQSHTYINLYEKYIMKPEQHGSPSNNHNINGESTISQLHNLMTDKEKEKFNNAYQTGSVEDRFAITVAMYEKYILKDTSGTEGANKPTGESAQFVDYISGKLNGKLDNASEIIEGLKNAVTADGSKLGTGLLDERFVRREAALKIAEYISQNYMNKEDGAYFMSEMKKLAGDTEKREIALGNSTFMDDKGIEQPVDRVLERLKKSDFIASYADWNMNTVMDMFSKPNGKSFDDVMSRLMGDALWTDRSDTSKPWLDNEQNDTSKTVVPKNPQTPQTEVGAQAKPTDESSDFVDYIAGKLDGKLEKAHTIIRGLKNAVAFNSSQSDPTLLEKRDEFLKVAENISQKFLNEEDGAYFMSEMKKLAGAE